MTEEPFDGAREDIELALPGDTIRKKHIATRASNRRQIIVLMVGDAEFVGYSIGLDGHTLQILELPSGEVSSVALEYIVSISDGKSFNELTRVEKDTVDRRTASFRKISHNWLVANWPNVYDRRDDNGEDHSPRINSKLVKTEYQARQEFADREKRLSGDADSEVRNGASEDGDQG